MLETLAMLMIGDSVLALISPRRHVALWISGPGFWQRTVTPLLRRPNLVRTLGLAGLVAGVWLAWREEPAAPLPRREVSSGRRWARRLAEAMQ
jgi:hypothetical protein